MRPLAFVDLETTGATATSDRITEIGIVEVDADGSVREWQQLINPGMPIPPFIEQLTGISNDMVADAPGFETVADEVMRRLAGRLFIAHNARFDYGFLKQEFKRLGRVFRAPVLCTVQLSRHLFPEHKRHNLDSLVERFALGSEIRHRALGDARLIHRLWLRLHEAPGAEAVQGALQALNTHPSLPDHLDPGLADDLPEEPGVYLFFGENDQPLYVGRAKNLKKRVLSHFSTKPASPREMALAQQVRRIDWVESTGDIGAHLREAALIKEMQPAHNRTAPASGEACSWTLVDEGDGWLRPVLAPIDGLDFALENACYGLFKNAKEAHQVLRSLAAEHHLCDTLLGVGKSAPGQPCQGHQAKRCKGACIGKEPAAKHTMRLIGALVRFKNQSWPFPGPALIREENEAHVIDAWRYLGTVRSEEEVRQLLAGARPEFEREIYKILTKAASRLEPLGK